MTAQLRTRRLRRLPSRRCWLVGTAAADVGSFPLHKQTCKHADFQPRNAACLDLCASNLSRCQPASGRCSCATTTFSTHRRCDDFEGIRCTACPNPSAHTQQRGLISKRKQDLSLFCSLRLTALCSDDWRGLSPITCCLMAATPRCIAWYHQAVSSIWTEPRSGPQAPQVAAAFQRAWPAELQLFRRDCRHHSTALAAALCVGEPALDPLSTLKLPPPPQRGPPAPSD